MHKPPAYQLPVILSALILGVFATPALAQNEPVMGNAAIESIQAVPPPSPSQADILPVKAASDTDLQYDDNPTDPAVMLTPDRSELVRVSKKPAAVIVGNPAHLDILPEGNNTLILVPKAPGATYFTVLDEDNKVIMQRHVIVDSPKEKYVRIRKSCAGGAKNCQATQVYYCPDMCHQIIIGSSKDSGQKAPSGKDTGISVSDDVDDSGNSADTGTDNNSGSDSRPAPEDTDQSTEPAE